MRGNAESKGERMLTPDETITLFFQGFKLLFLRRAGGAGWSFCLSSCCPLPQGAPPRRLLKVSGP